MGAPSTAQAPATGDTEILDRLSALHQQMKEMSAILKDHHEFLTVLSDERKAQAQSAGAGADHAGAATAPGGAAAPSAMPGRAPVPGDGKFEQAKALMDLAGKYLGPETPAGPAAGDFQARLAEMTLQRIASETRLTDAIGSAFAEGMKARVRGAVSSALPEFP